MTTIQKTTPSKMEPIYRKVGTTLRAYREGRGLSQEAVATKMGVTRPSYANMELGKQRIQLHHLTSLARIHKVDPAILLDTKAVTPKAKTDRALLGRSKAAPAKAAAAKKRGTAKAA